MNLGSPEPISGTCLMVSTSKTVGHKEISYRAWWILLPLSCLMVHPWMRSNHYPEKKEVVQLLFLDPAFFLQPGAPARNLLKLKAVACWWSNTVSYQTPLQTNKNKNAPQPSNPVRAIWHHPQLNTEIKYQSCIQCGNQTWAFSKYCTTATLLKLSSMARTWMEDHLRTLHMLPWVPSQKNVVYGINKYSMGNRGYQGALGLLPKHQLLPSYGTSTFPGLLKNADPTPLSMGWGLFCPTQEQKVPPLSKGCWPARAGVGLEEMETV